jgi:hypothetical protein
MEHQIYVVLCTATTVNPLIDDQVCQNVAVGNPFFFFFVDFLKFSQFCGEQSFLDSVEHGHFSILC